MKLKMDDQGHVVVTDGKPVYTADDGRETAFDYVATLATISRLNGEAKGHREGKEALEAKFKAFEGIEDPAKAIKALEVVKNLGDKQLIDAGEVERIKAEANTAFEEKLKAQEKKYKPVVEERDRFQNELHQEKIGGAFNRSKFIQEKMAIPLDLAQAKFGGNFTFEDGKIVAKDSSGNVIYSQAKPGEKAEFDEALEILVHAYPHRDNIMKGSGASGSGAGGSGTNASGKKTYTRAVFDKMDPTAKAAAVKEAVIVD